MQGLCRPTHYTGQSVQDWETGLLFFQSAPTPSGPGPSAYSASLREGFFSETAFKIALPSFYFTAVTVRRGTISVDGVQNSPGLERVRHERQGAEGVPCPERYPEHAQYGCHPFKIPAYWPTRYGEAEGGGEERHGDSGAGGKEQQGAHRLGPVGDCREQEQRKPARAADPVHEPYPVGAHGRPVGEGVGVLVGSTLPVRVYVPVGRLIVVAVGVSVVEATPPPHEQPHGEEHDDRPY